MIIPSFFIIIPPLVHHFQSLVHHYSMTIPSFPPIFHHCSMIILSSSIIIPSSSILAGMRLPHFPKGSSCQLPGHAWSAPFRGYLCSLHGLRGSRTTGLAGDLEMLMFYGVLWCFMVCKPPYRMAKHGEHMRKSCSNHGEFHGFVVGKTMP